MGTIHSVAIKVATLLCVSGVIFADLEQGWWYLDGVRNDNALVQGLSHTLSDAHNKEFAIIAEPAVAQDAFFGIYGIANDMNTAQLYRAPQTVGSPNFLTFSYGITNTLQAAVFPPDCHGAIGPSQFIAVCQGRIGSFDRTTGAPGTFNVTLDNFFASVRAGLPVTNPRVKFDRLSNRWFVIANTQGAAGSTGNRIVVAVSTGSTVASIANFVFNFITATDLSNVAYYHDYPTIGITANAVYIGGASYTGQGTNLTIPAQIVYVASKSSLFTAGAISFTKFGLPSTDVFVPQGVDVFDAAPTFTGGYFIAASPTYSKMRLVKIINPLSSPSIAAQIDVSVPSWSDALNVQNRGVATRLDGLDIRLTAAHVRNNQLWTVHNIGVDNMGRSGANVTPTRNGSRWYQIDLMGNTQTVSRAALAQSGTLYASQLVANTSDQLHYWVPSIMTSGQGHMAIGCCSAGDSGYASAVTAGKLATQVNATGVPDLIAAGLQYAPTSTAAVANGVYKWGVYSYTSLDPLDDMTMWTIVPYASGVNEWGLRAAKLVAPPPATPLTTNPQSLFQNQTQAVQVIGVSSKGSGFYDPGAGYAMRMTVTLTGIDNIRITNLQYVSPTQFVMTVSTSDSLGDMNIQVTNPDGQSVTVNGLLNVGVDQPCQY